MVKFNNMTRLIKNREVIAEWLKQLDGNDAMRIHNEEMDSNGYADNMYYSNDEEFFDTFFHCKAYDVVQRVFYGDYRFSDNFVCFNGYGNLESCNWIELDIEGITESILVNPEMFDIELIEEEGGENE